MTKLGKKKMQRIQDNFSKLKLKFVKYKNQIFVPFKKRSITSDGRSSANNQELEYSTGYICKKNNNKCSLVLEPHHPSSFYLIHPTPE